ncbi:hypothetical protein GCM10011512_21250 [Tersicoccus solisilvae]|uniref:DUF2891 domain-containing protein n=1 Tax=Tersicoccus solisilvae TaxID=1882339 RepID=A0ABQ1P9U4_9MICC|nr:DUF2891 family protein [Tersicoccus solisilvae]GGC93964.1 hypothetical protein GCM10011512_21250 [Tersicoccus solisilvae]
MSASAVSLDRSAWASAFARVVIGNLQREYPYVAHHATAGPDDRALPVDLHPAFATSYDWHSSVHMHWLAARLLAYAATAPDAHGIGLEEGLKARLTDLLSAHLTGPHVQREAEYLTAAPDWERPYGWAWAFRLAAEVSTSEVPAVRALAPGFAPFLDVLEDVTARWLANAAYPVRHGVHGNSAFGLMLTLDAARVLGRTDLADTASRTARAWFGADAGWPFAWERSGHDFLSAGLAEADLMRAVLPPAEFAGWAEDFFSALRPGDDVLAPAVVRDENDPQQVHLFGLDLSRAGAARRIVDALRSAGAAGGPVDLLEPAVDPLLAAGLAASVGEEYYSTHWLASFAWDAMEAREHAARTAG